MHVVQAAIEVLCVVERGVRGEEQAEQCGHQREDRWKF
jgi:hypothetical protein